MGDGQVKRYKLPEQEDPVFPQEVATKNYVDNSSGGGAFDYYKIKTANEDKTNDNSLAIDSDLQQTLGPGTYAFEALAYYSAESSLPDIRFKFGMDSGSFTNTADVSGYETGAFLGSTIELIGFVTTEPISGTTIEILTMKGIIVVTASGLFGLYWSQNNSNANWTRLHAGSYLRIKQAN